MIIQMILIMIIIAGVIDIDVAGLEEIGQLHEEYSDCDLQGNPSLCDVWTRA